MNDSEIMLSQSDCKEVYYLNWERGFRALCDLTIRIVHIITCLYRVLQVDFYSFRVRVNSGIDCNEDVCKVLLKWPSVKSTQVIECCVFSQNTRKHAHLALPRVKTFWFRVVFEVIKQISLLKNRAGVTGSTALGPVFLFNQLPQAFLSGVTSSAPFRVMT